jgi:hypothetical protein
MASLRMTSVSFHTGGENVPAERTPQRGVPTMRIAIAISVRKKAAQ